jgi:hypothetical protein
VPRLAQAPSQLLLRARARGRNVERKKVPEPGKMSGCLFERFRDDLRSQGDSGGEIASRLEAYTSISAREIRGGMMNSTKKTARLAGLLYVLVSIPGAFGLLYLPSHFVVSGDATATANKIVASEFVFRLCIVAELTGFIGFIFVVRALYRLLCGVNKTHASLMLTLMLVSIPISLLNVLNEIAALTLARGADFLSTLDKPQRDAMAMLFLDLHRYGIVVPQIFWGLWLVPFGILVFKSGFLPRILGVLLIIACFGYVTESVTPLLFPSYAHIVSSFASKLTLGEAPIIFWLLIMGAKDQPLAVPA